jgi:hypothetical protein
MQNLSKKNEGFSLLMTMVLFVALTVVGIAVMRSGILSEKQTINIQESSTVFHVSQSANNAVLNALDYSINIHLDAFEESKNNRGNNYKNHNRSKKYCIDDVGQPVECNTNPKFKDPLLASTDVYYRGCEKGLRCAGYSATQAAAIACYALELHGTGYIDSNSNNSLDNDESKTVINQWATRPLMANEDCF